MPFVETWPLGQQDSEGEGIGNERESKELVLLGSSKFPFWTRLWVCLRGVLWRSGSLQESWGVN
jgi:hypothetical protein